MVRDVFLEVWVIIEIFKINKDEEEKQKLFQEKVKELQELFKSESLDKLKELNLLDNYGQEDTTGIGNIEEGDREGSDGDSVEQEETDWGNQIAG